MANLTLNRATKISDGSFTYWLADGADPAMDGHPATPTPAQYTDFVTVGEFPGEQSSLILHGKTTHATGADSLWQEPPDPGDTKDLVTTASAHYSLVSGGSSEARGLPDPSFVGQQMLVTFRTDGGGDIVITAASPVNQNGDNTVTFVNVDDSFHVIAIGTVAGPRWRVCYADPSSMLSTV